MMKHKLKVILYLLPLLMATKLSAQNPDSLTKLAATYFHQADSAAKNQTIWSKPVYGPTFFVDSDRRVWANVPDSAGFFKPDGGIFTGYLSKDVMVANTDIYWGGKHWSIMLWPLYGNHDERLNLILHESFHRIQASLNLPAKSPTAGHLSTKNGRIYFLLELQALKSAISKPVNQRKADLESALLFKKKRELLFPNTFNNEEQLESSEGLAEYTGVILGRDKKTIPAHLNEVIDGAAKKESLIRSVAYITGPIYGWLLYNANPKWTLKIDSGSKFSNLIAGYYHIYIASLNIDAEVEKRQAKYDGKNIIASETLKDEAHKKVEDQFINLFTVKPVLNIELQKMSVNFNPNNLFDLGDYGTVYPTILIKDDWGELKVTQQGALMKNWKQVYLPMPVAPTAAGNHITTANWELNIAPGWQIVADGANYKLVKK